MFTHFDVGIGMRPYTSFGNMSRVCGLPLGPNLGVQLVADKKFYLQLTVFIEKYLQPYCCVGTNLPVAVNYANPKTGIQSEIVQMEIIEKKFSL